MAHSGMQATLGQGRPKIKLIGDRETSKNGSKI